MQQIELPASFREKISSSSFIFLPDAVSILSNSSIALTILSLSKILFVDDENEIVFFGDLNVCNRKDLIDRKILLKRKMMIDDVFTSIFIKSADY